MKELRKINLIDEQVKFMVDRFLCWRLPENFHPDCGIKFDADAAKALNPNNARYEPVGTNLFDYAQAEAMVRHMLNIAPNPPIAGDGGMTESKATEWPSQKARELALDLERRGSIEGHYVWAEMIQHALDNAFSEGFEKGQAHGR